MTRRGTVDTPETGQAIRLPPVTDQEKRYDVVGLGFAAADHLFVVEAYPPPGAKVRSVLRLSRPGGQVANALVALSRWGCRVAYIGRLGTDGDAMMIKQWLDRAGVNRSALLEIPQSLTHHAVVIVDRGSGERTIIWNRDDSQYLRSTDVPQQLVQDCKVLHLDGHEVEACLRAASWAKEAGARVVLDAEDQAPGMDALIRLADVVIGSESFLQDFLGRRRSLRSTLKELSSLGPAVVGLTQGRKGAMVFSGGEFVRHPGYQVTAVDSTGAGDLFHAGFCLGLLQGWDLATTLSYSSAAAALGCLSLGASDGTASREQTRAFTMQAKPARRLRPLPGRQDKSSKRDL